MQKAALTGGFCYLSIYSIKIIFNFLFFYIQKGGDGVPSPSWLELLGEQG